MRRITLSTTKWAGTAVAALAICQISCKGPLDDEESLAEGLVPPVGQRVAGTTPGAPAQIDPNAINGVRAQPSAGSGTMEFGSGTGYGSGAPGVAFGQPDATAIATAQPAPVVPTVPYVIKKGDSLSKIAETNNTSVANLQRLNGIKGTFIRYGQTIRVPAAAGTAAVETAPVTQPQPGAVSGETPTGIGNVPPPPEKTFVPPPAPAPASGGIDPNGTGLGFGGTSAPRPRTPPATNDDFLNLPSPN